MNQGSADLTEDPGEVDNRLSLNPEDFPVTEDWEDGESYPLTALGKGVTLRQISPGEFEVVPLPGGTPPEEAEAEEEAPPKRKRGGYSNPAVEGLMNEE